MGGTLKRGFQLVMGAEKIEQSKGRVASLSGGWGCGWEGLRESGVWAAT